MHPMRSSTVAQMWTLSSEHQLFECPLNHKVEELVLTNQCAGTGRHVCIS